MPGVERWIARLARRRAPHAARLGRRGERAAARALRRAGYRILARNLVTPRGEIDLLAMDGGVLVVVEVKSARRGHGPPPEARLRRSQRQRLRAAGAWLARRPTVGPVTLRFDLVAVTFDGGCPVVTIRRGFF
ncbi:MAG: YraN family protein [Planctomycetota bacterium]|jgi:putative endonuclease